MTNQPFTIRRARRGAIKLRVAFLGKTGEGKSYSALALALHLAELMGLTPEDVVVLDSEVTDDAADATGSVEKYCGDHCRCAGCQGHGMVLDGFGTILLMPGRQKPGDYVGALASCRAAGIPIVVIDSMTHEWDSCLKMVDDIKARNKWAQGWGEVTPKHDRFVQAILNYPGHVICTVRGKEKHAQEGKEVVSQGVLPVQRPGILYEFDVAMFMHGARGSVVKTRAAALDGRTFDRPGRELAGALLEWCSSPTADRDRAEAQKQESRGKAQAEAQAPRDKEQRRNADQGRGNAADDVRKGLIKLGKSKAAQDLGDAFLEPFRAHYKACTNNPVQLAKVLAWARKKVAEGADPDPTATGATQSRSAGSAPTEQKQAPDATTDRVATNLDQAPNERPDDDPFAPDPVEDGAFNPPV